MNFTPVFITATARGGSNFLAAALNQHEKINVACAPYLELFRSFRTAAINSAGLGGCLPGDLETAVFFDYYFLARNGEIIDALEGASLDQPVTAKEWTRILPILKRRGLLEAADLVPLYDRLQARTYREAIVNGLKLIPAARELAQVSHIGMKEAWIVELFVPLARAFPEAKFIVLVRDPRASITSNNLTKERGKIANAVSFAKAWRKNVAYSIYLSQTELMRERLFVMAIEQMSLEPERTTSELCSFLNLDFDPRMIDPGSYFNWGAREKWQGNSRYGGDGGFVSEEGMRRWRTRLKKDIWKTVDLICGPEMKLMGYAADFEFDGTGVDSDVVDYLQREYGETRAWRSDFGRLEMDYGMELFRRSLLADPPPALAVEAIRRHFLFPEVFEALKGETPLPLHLAGTARPAA